MRNASSNDSEGGDSRLVDPVCRDQKTYATNLLVDLVPKEYSRERDPSQSMRVVEGYRRGPGQEWKVSECRALNV